MEGLGKMPPQSKELEEAVIGSILNYKTSMEKASVLSPDDFYSTSFKLIFKECLSLYSNNKPIDLITVCEALTKSNNMDEVGGPYVVATASNSVDIGTDIDEHITIIKQKSISRGIIENLNNRVREAYNDEDPFKILEEIDNFTFKTQSGTIKKEARNIQDISKDVYESVEEAALNEGETVGIPTKIKAIDKYTSGLKGGNLIVIAARPAMGKTAFILSMMANIAKSGEPVAMFSLEMTDKDCIKRVHANVCNIDNEKLKTGTLTENEWGLYNKKLQNVTGLPIFIDDSPTLNVVSLKSKVRKMVRNGVKAIFIDYLQLMEMPSGKEFATRDQQIGHITRSLKILAKEMDIPIILLSQLSRAVEMRSDKRPQLSDLRESGNIEQDADIVWMLYRPSYYGITPTDTSGYPYKDTYAELLYVKNRDGYVGSQGMNFEGAHFRFTDYNDFSNYEGNVESINSFPVESKNDEFDLDFD